MWPEILPGFAVMVGALTVSGLAIGIIDRLETGGKVRPRWVFPKNGVSELVKKL
jgi:hypothetical protein